MPDPKCGEAKIIAHTMRGRPHLDVDGACKAVDDVNNAGAETHVAFCPSYRIPTFLLQPPARSRGTHCWRLHASNMLEGCSFACALGSKRFYQDCACHVQGRETSTRTAALERKLSSLLEIPKTVQVTQHVLLDVEALTKSPNESTCEPLKRFQPLTIAWSFVSLGC